MVLRRNGLALGGIAAAIAAALGLARPASAAPIVIPTPVADALKGSGQGLCVASAVSMSPANDFPQMAGVFNSGMNAFIEAHKLDRKEYVQRTIFDLSNNYKVGVDTRSYGDFLDAMLPTCKTGGCDFFLNDSTTAFGARFRGFLNVTSDLVGAELHLAFYTDDAVSLVIFDKTGNGYSVMTQPPVLGIATWRVTQQVQFDAAGLYPVEILYAEIADHAALEMSFIKGPFTDFQRSINDPMGKNLKTAGFGLFHETNFFQTLSGEPSYPNLDQCKQCDRQFVGQFGNNGCDPGYICNEAALCAPCDSDIYCGPTCQKCTGMTAHCITSGGMSMCGECRDDGDCQVGFSCDLTTHTCNECNVDPDCPRGKQCVMHSCTWCDTADKCAGNSCNCCPDGQNGKQMQCKQLDPSDPPECVECLSDADCANAMKCDTTTGQCFAALPAMNEESPMSCGTQHLNCTCCSNGADNGCTDCPNDKPLSLCLPGPFGTACAECRQDTQCDVPCTKDEECKPSTCNQLTHTCADSAYCRGGNCLACLTDKRCGERCASCGGDTPFCLDTQKVEEAKCVRCNTDDQCVGGTCDKTKHECTDACAMSCGGDTPHCDGNKCVECYADTQCPCAGSCDLTSHTCTTSCKNNGDCNGDAHCHHTNDGSAKTCSPGPLPDNVDCGSTLADICSGGSIGSRGGNPTPASGIVGLSLLALWMRRRQSRRTGVRGQSPAKPGGAPEDGRGR